jgi:hypothetical protein
VSETDDIDRQLNFLEAEIKKLEAEYNMYFAGRLQRPPWEMRKRVEGLVKQMDRAHIPNYGQKFRFTTLQTRFAKSIDLWDRGLRAREEGRAGPFALPRPAPVVEDKPKAARAEDRVLHVTTFEDPLKEMEKVHQLYDELAQARKQAGQDAIPFHKFADLVKTQVNSLKEKGSPEVAFRVAVKDGKVAVTARGLKGKSKK